MWSYEHTVDAEVRPESIWRLYADVEGWGAWDISVAEARLHGPFAVGTEVSLTTHGQDTARSRIAQLVEHELFVDETDLGSATLRFVHRLTPLDGDRTRITHRVEIRPGGGPDRPQPGTGSHRRRSRSDGRTRRPGERLTAGHRERPGPPALDPCLLRWTRAPCSGSGRAGMTATHAGGPRSRCCRS